MTLNVLSELGDVLLFGAAPAQRSAGWGPFLVVMGGTLGILAAGLWVLA